ncbi:hypothetical protein DL765_004578 [Monosporascus sp. GIB2]|nr:hypothetical protein DL765_004578 [Monosporascus sp. GIB2]
MNGSHLPAGQTMPGAVGGGGGGGIGGRGPADIVSGSHTGSGGGRRRPPTQQQYPSHPQTYHPHHYHQQQQHHMYHHNYVNAYPNSYYPQMPIHYQNGASSTAPYMTYNPYLQRSPMHQQYPPIVSSSMQPHPQPYSRTPQQQPSPAISTPPPYQQVAPPPQVPVPETPSSTHSSQVAPAQSTPATPQTGEIAVTSAPPAPPEIETRSSKEPFKYPLPWLSRPDLPFPNRAAKARRRRPIMTSEATSVELPTNQQVESHVEEQSGAPMPETPTPKTTTSTATTQDARPPPAQDLPSEEKSSASQTTPAFAPATQTSATATIAPTKSTKPTSRAAVPAVPVLPAVPKASTKETKTATSEKTLPDQQQTSQGPTSDKPADDAPPPAEKLQPEAKAEVAPAPAKARPKLWAGLFANPTPTGAPAATGTGTGSAAAGSVNGDPLGGASGAVAGAGFAKANASSLAEAIRGYRVGGGHKIAFLEPRGLINTGNMCYMNSVLQVLIFCIPFYDFLDQVSKKAAYSFKSETPLIDAMVNFMGEYKVIDSAVSVDQLRRRLKNEELEQYGEPFTPEFVYEAIRKLPRFASMRRGHQQDAEEFLGFLLEALHDECAHVMRHLPDSRATTAANSSAATPAPSSPTSATDSSDWLEVGRRQRAAVTRSSGHPVASSPITKIFGGQLRSELRVSGLKDSVTLEPFQPLQLDIGSPQVRNIVDALRGLTKPETLHGDFGSPRGKDAVATKQVFLESLPPVLILHLKRFQFDGEGTGTVKIWKRIGYPLELELPKEILSRQKRNSLLAEGAGFPKYRLIAAVYHHGKNASGGHYTVDLRRQDGREWIRLDDTVIRRVRSEDVAEGGVEEDPLAAPTSEHKRDSAVSGSGNRFDGIGDDAGEEDGWNKVSAPMNGAKKWSSVVNGAATTGTMKGKPAKDNIKDNKVAYLLFYQRV